MSARQCGEGDGPAFAELLTESTHGDYAVDAYYVCRQHLAPVLSELVEDGHTIEVRTVTR